MDLPGMSPHSREEFGVAHDERRRIQRSLDVGQPDRDAALGFFNEIPSVIENSSHFAGGQGRTGEVIDVRWISECQRLNRREIALPPDDLAAERGRDVDNPQSRTEAGDEIALEGHLVVDLGELSLQEFRRVEETIGDRALSFGREEGRTEGATSADLPP